MIFKSNDSKSAHPAHVSGLFSLYLKIHVAKPIEVCRLIENTKNNYEKDTKEKRKLR